MICSKSGLAALSAPALLAQPRFAQAKYPDRPVRLIVPFPPGGAYDTIGRPWADRMKAMLGTRRGREHRRRGRRRRRGAASRSRPDGYTLLLGGATTHITEALLKTKPTYDPLKDLEPISPIAVTAFAIAVHPSVPAKDLKEFVAYVKANPGKVSYGSAGHGSLNHLTGELFKLRAGLTDLPHVPYRGAGPALTDLLAGQIPVLVPAMTNIVLEHHKAGKLRVLAVTHAQAARGRARAADRGRAGLPRRGRAELHRLCSRRPACRGRSSNTVAAANLKLLAEKSYQELLIIGHVRARAAAQPGGVQAIRRERDEALAADRHRDGHQDRLTGQD